MTVRRRRRPNLDKLRADPSLPAALEAAMSAGHRRQAVMAGMWAALGVGGDTGARAAESALRRARNVAMPGIPGIPVADGVEVRVSLSRWGKEEVAHVRTWFRGRDERWRPTRRGVTVPPEQLEQLEAAVRALREAYASGALRRVSSRSD